MEHWYWDERISARLCVAEIPGWRRRLAILTTHSGDAPYLLIIMGALIVLAPPPWPHIALVMMIIDGINLLITLTIKAIVGRARPKGEWGKVYRRIDPNSFPSGHSSRGGAMGMAAMIMMPLIFGLPLLFWGMCVAFSRVAMGVHYLSDVIAGYFLGLLVGGLLVTVLF